jgi:hypothetical protein
VDGRLSKERRLACRNDLGSAWSIDADRWEWSAALPDADPPRIQQHASEVTGVVDMEVAEEHGLQTREVETGLDECGRCPSSAFDDEDASVDDKG